VDSTDDTYEDDDNDSVRSFSESEMGSKGGPFTDADLYVTAKYVAAFPAFDEASAKERWQPYSDRVCSTLLCKRLLSCLASSFLTDLRKLGLNIIADMNDVRLQPMI
jgi:hypothetical protein